MPVVRSALGPRIIKPHYAPTLPHRTTHPNVDPASHELSPPSGGLWPGCARIAAAGPPALAVLAPTRNQKAARRFSLHRDNPSIESARIASVALPRLNRTFPSPGDQNRQLAEHRSTLSSLSSHTSAQAGPTKPRLPGAAPQGVRGMAGSNLRVALLCVCALHLLAGAHAQQNKAPVCQQPTIAPAVPVLGSPVDITFTATDSNGDIASIQWAYNDGALASTSFGLVRTAATASVSVTPAFSGMHAVRFLVTDKGGLTCEKSVTFGVSLPPTCGSIVQSECADGL